MKTFGGLFAILFGLLALVLIGVTASFIYGTWMLEKQMHVLILGGATLVFEGIGVAQTIQVILRKSEEEKPIASK